MILLVTSNFHNTEGFPSGGNGFMSVDNHYGLEVGSMVEVPMRNGGAKCGVIHWIGSVPQIKGKLVAGLELVSEIIYQAQPE